jgi:bifunctional non-homologous end joining protein LigD
MQPRPEQKFVVCGFTEGKGRRRKYFGRLLLAAYRESRLRYFGHSETGFSEKGLQDAMNRLKPLYIKNARWRIHRRFPRKSSG